VLEKHADFLRDFRGDTIHPSTLELIHELGILQEFLRHPHQEVQQMIGQIGDALVPIADFARLPTQCRFVALMPQWDFLDFVAEQARGFAAFRLEMEAEVDDLVIADGRVAGVHATTPKGELVVRADLVVGADGRHSTVRARAGLDTIDRGAPIDVLWLRLSRRPDDPGETLGRFDARRRGLPFFRDEIARLAPHLRDRTAELADWPDIKLLTVMVDHLRVWHRSGLLCIGDAAHAMSPIGGVGINLAIQDAVAAANLLAAPLRRGTIADADLRAVQRRREFPTRATQSMQLLIQNRVFSRVLDTAKPLSPPLFLRLPLLRRVLARLVGMGFRPEHIRLPSPA
jgi:2-polyprenyl-6-methoxyphenol hydroxylase-like FAD-dependent oxidoreductase